ncbi:Hypothetical predicted protein [Mytilus galloprovincialis]|uniref:Uncharacterized protein n=1 Tax=Mytilus galloprovincialis TaxID=29158 RepID=A0A8B6F7F8_MYTGA|nr:Hypothetical predicted protein [Mytilus galloprovincialis]
MKYEEKSPSTPVKLPLLLPNKKMKYVEDSFSETLKRQPLLPNKKIIYAKELSDTTLKLPPVLPDKEKTFIYRPGTPKLLPPLQNFPQNIKKTIFLNKIKDEKKDKSKDMSTELMSKPAPQQPADTTASNENLDMSPKLGSKRPKWKNKYKTFRLQKRSRKNYYKNEEKQTDRAKPDRYPEPDKIHTLPQKMKETSIVKKIRDEMKGKSKVIPTQSTSISATQKTAETTANSETFDMNSELALKRVKWENKFPTFRLQKASGKDCHISERKYRFSRLHKSSGKNCYIPKSKSDKGSNIVTEKYCTTRTQRRNVKKQTEIELPDNYPVPDQIHTWPQNLKKILIVKKVRNEKKDNSEVVRSMPLSAPEQTDKTTAFNKMYKSEPEQADVTTAFTKMSKSTQQQTDRTTTSNKMSKSAQQEADETTASNKMFKSAPQQIDETKASNKMSKPATDQTDKITAFNRMSKSTQQRGR